MKKIIITILILFSNSTFAGEFVPMCEPVKGGWDKVKEEDFSRESIVKKLDSYKESFSKGYVSNDEGLDEMLMFIKGAALRQAAEYWQNEPKSDLAFQSTKKSFCEFYKSAYLPH